MGCNQSVPDTVVLESKVSEIPCQPEDIGKYLNDIRANPEAYANILQREIDKFTDEYSLMIDQDVLYRTNEGKEVWKETIDFLRQAKPLPPLVKH